MRQDLIQELVIALGLTNDEKAILVRAAELCDSLEPNAEEEFVDLVANIEEGTRLGQAINEYFGRPGYPHDTFENFDAGIY